MKIETLYDQGTMEHAEDQHIEAAPFVAVTDGVSAPYSAVSPMRLFYGVSGGRMAAAAICRCFAEASSTAALSEIIFRANHTIGASQEQAGISLGRPDLLAGACVAAVKIEESHIRAIQTGDAFVIWSLRSGEVNATRDQVAMHDAWFRATFAQLMAEHGGNREAAWEAIHPLRCKRRRSDVNGEGVSAFGLITGQPAFTRHLVELTFAREELAQLILCTDGLVCFCGRRESDEIARSVWDIYAHGGLGAVLEQVRNYEHAQTHSSHLIHREITAIAITL